MKKFIHYGSNNFEIDRFEKIKNRHDMSFEKPDGGLWASPINSRDNWHDWCLNNDFHTEKLKDSFIFTLLPNSRVLTIKTVQDITNILNMLTAVPLGRKRRHIDFEELLKLGYDAIEVYIDDVDVYYRLYGWDVDSLLVLNPFCIEVIEHDRSMCDVV